MKLQFIPSASIIKAYQLFLYRIMYELHTKHCVGTVQGFLNATTGGVYSKKTFFSMAQNPPLDLGFIILKDSR